jgi:hypothetical protein
MGDATAAEVPVDPQNEAFGGSARNAVGVLPQSPAFRTIGMPTDFVELSTSARSSSQVTFFRVLPAALGRAANASAVITPTAARSPTVERFRMAFFLVRPADLGKPLASRIARGAA